MAVTGATQETYDLSFLNKGESILLDAQLFARQIDALICLTEDSSLHFVSKTVLDTMAKSQKEFGTNGSILTDSLFNNKSMVFNIGTHCDYSESILVQIPLAAYSTSAES